MIIRFEERAFTNDGALITVGSLDSVCLVFALCIALHCIAALASAWHDCSAIALSVAPLRSDVICVCIARLPPDAESDIYK